MKLAKENLQSYFMAQNIERQETKANFVLVMSHCLLNGVFRELTTIALPSVRFYFDPRIFRIFVSWYVFLTT